MVVCLWWVRSREGVNADVSVSVGVRNCCVGTHNKLTCRYVLDCTRVSEAFVSRCWTSAHVFSPTENSLLVQVVIALSVLRFHTCDG